MEQSFTRQPKLVAYPNLDLWPSGKP